MILTSEDIFKMSGYVQKQKQIDYLESRGIKYHDQDRNGPIWTTIQWVNESKTREVGF